MTCFKTVWYYLNIFLHPKPRNPEQCGNCGKLLKGQTYNGSFLCSSKCSYEYHINTLYFA